MACPHDNAALTATGDTTEGGRIVARNYVCVENGHVWVEAVGDDGLRAWSQIGARQGGLL